MVNTTTFLTRTGMITMTRRKTKVATRMKKMRKKMTKNQAMKKIRKTAPMKMSSISMTGIIIRVL
jgi:F0F1-type ATP synthase assembly protein I